jgi:hypothetical protein
MENFLIFLQESVYQPAVVLGIVKLGYTRKELLATISNTDEFIQDIEDKVKNFCRLLKKNFLLIKLFQIKFLPVRGTMPIAYSGNFDLNEAIGDCKDLMDRMLPPGGKLQSNSCSNPSQKNKPQRSKQYRSERIEWSKCSRTMSEPT